ncbi:MAG: Ig-like domain-containing protein, partial [Candidatus Komeilibacteria bacterium]|nr:Ig-like domain-containing protein [Candidatus Komeilibacteria bacterium]
DGSVVAAPIWNRFMRNALKNKAVEGFIKPNITYPDKPVLRGDLEKGIPVKIDRISGLLATDLTPESQIEEVISQTGHTILYYVKRDDPLGPEPTPEERDGQYSSWESAVQAWLKKNNWQSIDLPTEFDNVHTFENKPSITLVSPAENETIKTMPLIFQVTAAAKRGITRVDFYLDDVLLGSKYEAPYTFTYDFASNLPNGFHTIRSAAFDDVDNSESVQANFNLFLER